MKIRKGDVITDGLTILIATRRARGLSIHRKTNAVVADCAVCPQYIGDRVTMMWIRKWHIIDNIGGNW